MDFKRKLFYLIRTYNKNITNLNSIAQEHYLIKNIFVRDNAAKYFIWFKKNYKYLDYFYNLLENYDEQQLFLEMVANKLGAVCESEQN